MFVQSGILIFPKLDEATSATKPYKKVLMYIVVSYRYWLGTGKLKNDSITTGCWDIHLSGYSIM